MATRRTQKERGRHADHNLVKFRFYRNATQQKASNEAIVNGHKCYVAGRCSQAAIQSVRSSTSSSSLNLSPDICYSFSRNPCRSCHLVSSSCRRGDCYAVCHNEQILLYMSVTSLIFLPARVQGTSSRNEDSSGIWQQTCHKVRFVLLSGSGERLAPSFLCRTGRSQRYISGWLIVVVQSAHLPCP